MWSFLDRARSRWFAKSAARHNKQAGEYWQSRCNMAYYQEVIRLARKYAPAARSVLDVGPNGTPLVCELDWIPSKTVVDLAPSSIPGATCIQGDFLRYQPDRVFDLVLCLQVLEHVGPADAFAQKLLATGKTVIISVPYCWPAGSCKPHIHDPVDRAKLLAWTAKPSLEDLTVRDRRRERLIAVFEGNCHWQNAAAERAA